MLGTNIQENNRKVAMKIPEVERGRQIHKWWRRNGHINTHLDLVSKSRVQKIKLHMHPDRYIISKKTYIRYLWEIHTTRVCGVFIINITEYDLCITMC